MSRKKFICLDCKVDTGRIHEHYFVLTEIWLSAVGSKKGMLCIGCLETRLKRRLTKADFPPVTINNPKLTSMSMRLLDRLST